MLLQSLTTLLAAATVVLAAPTTTKPCLENRTVTAPPPTFTNATIAMVGPPVCFTIYSSTLKFARLPDFGPTIKVTTYQATETVTSTLDLNCSGCHLQVRTKSVHWGHGPVMKSKKATTTITIPATTTTVYQCSTSPWS
ncbi:hypothetical protein TWF694_000274 [Orbilia ellipsospora]|uniref:Ig-like domain-containing protein n=1 Tax=Orbilia ellipsospora TaxID=2528407 RepID=A0AAV9XUS1_9PEZI